MMTGVTVIDMMVPSVAEPKVRVVQDRMRDRDEFREDGSW